MRTIDADELRALVPMSDAIDAVERAFREPRATTTPARAHHAVGDADMLVMPAWSDEAAGVKLVTVQRSNVSRGLPLIHGVYVLFERDTLAPEVVIDGAELTARRTAAVSAVATRHLSRPDATRLVVFGAGVQARAHIEAMAVVRDIAKITIVARTDEGARPLIEELRAAGLNATSGSPSDAATADIVCTCTTSPTPVLDGARLAAGTHVNAIGSYRPEHREVDDATVARARIVVESRAAALGEAGDLAIPLAAGLIDPADVAELSEVLAGTAPASPSSSDISLFKSVGQAFEDLAVAAAAVRGARR